MNFIIKLSTVFVLKILKILNNKIIKSAGIVLGIIFLIAFLIPKMFDPVYIFAFLLLFSYPFVLHSIYKNLEEVKEEELPIGTVIFLVISIIYIFLYGNISFHYELLVTNPITKISYIDALYWASTTFTTLGYGDYLPKDDNGKFLSMALSLTGIMHMVSFMAIILNKLNTHDKAIK